ncbi:FISUMP domain-containing protein [Sphingobacterium oryzagri]|uniref:FISUMP domain-containing protein n=1 Tax=Sphingobacterium oryzagri TaxID=3025669 RepID=A0ABY7WIP4_9SPHI|nr:FISUMP domain-containing protein [Sphingobacterium sp. KACC 22765]WDF68336.1 FISUMP domain-containing protein [Sphingobacterium sp. KACC 22765]
MESKIFTHYFGKVLILVVSTILFFSCAKDGGSEEVPVADGSTQLEFDVSGIADVLDAGAVGAEDDGHVAKAASAQHAGSSSASILEKTNVVDGEFDAVVTLERTKTASSLKNVYSKGTTVATASSNRSSLGSGSFVAAAMAAGVKYRVLIYTAADAYVGTIDATSGTAINPAFPVFKNTDYKWYAVSYNTTTQVAEPSNKATPTLDVTTAAQDLLFASGTIRTVAGGNKISIAFDRKMAVIKVRVDARGMFSPINSVDGTVTAATQGVVQSAGRLNLKTGAYNSTTANNSTINLNWSNESSDTGDSVKVAYIYTTGTSPIAGFGVNLSSLVLKLDNTQSPTRTFSNRNFNFTSSFTPTLGNRYTINIQLRESAVEIGGVKWARANLYFSASNPGYRFRQQSSNIYGTASNPAASGEYWNWRARKPGASGAETATGVVDPCTLVFPEGTWRMPDANEFNTLINVTSGSGTPRRSVGQTDNPTIRYAAWTNSATGSPTEYGINWTSWLSFGYRATGSNTIVNYNPSESTFYGYWWARDQVNTTNAQYFRANYTLNSNNSAYVATLEITPGTGTKTLGMNVRCVRTANN